MRPIVPSGPGRWPSLLTSFALLVITLIGAIARFDSLGTPGLWLDEILAVGRSEFSPLSSSWTPGSDPQHGPVYHGLLAAMRAVDPTERGLRAPWAVSGVLSVPVIYALGRLVGGPATGLLAAALLATSPLHIYLSREARPYGLLMLAELFGLLAVVHLGERPRSRGWLALLLGASALAVLTSSQGIWFDAVLLLSWGVVALTRPTMADRWRILSLIAIAGACLAALFLRLYGILLISGPDVIGPPPPTREFFAQLFQPLVSGYSEMEPATTLAYWAIACATAGVVAVSLDRPVHGVVLALVTVFGYALPVVALYIEGHGIRARYVLAALPGLLVLQALGLVAMATLFSRLVLARWPHLRRASTLVFVLITIVAVVKAQDTPTRLALSTKADWRHVAFLIRDRVHAGDLVLTSNDWGRVCLDFYLPRVGAAVELTSAAESIERAKQLVKGRQGAFLVTGGYHANTAIRDWMDGFHLLFASRAESIRLYYYPDRASYLAERAPFDQIARDESRLWESFEGRLEFNFNSEPFLLDGWSETETDNRGTQFRWAIGQVSRIYLPVTKIPVSLMSVELAPYPPLVGRQTVTILINDQVVGSYPLGAGWNTLDVRLDGVAWRHGGNIVTFEFSAAASPADLGSPDKRVLSAVFRSLSFRRTSSGNG